MNNRILIITYSMIPHAIAWGGCQRMYYLAEEFIKQGYRLSMFSVKNNINRDFGNKINFTHYPLPVRNHFFQAFINSKLQSGLNNKEYQNNTKIECIVSGIRNYIKKSKVLFNIIDNVDKYIFNEPSFLMGIITRHWCFYNKKIINEYIEKHHINCVIISGPPFGMFSIAKYINKNNPKVPIVLDYRDPWNLWKSKSLLALYLEKTNFKYADKIIFTNNNLALDMSKKFNIPKSKISIVSNGYSQKMWSKLDSNTLIDKNDQSMIITYTGSIDIVETSYLGFRDITQLFDAFNDVLESGYDIKIVFVGVANPNTSYAQDLIRLFKKHVEFIPAVSNEVALKYMINSDVLLILHTTNDASSKYLIGGKLYDYIKAEKYILSIGDVKGLNAQIVMDNGIGMAVNNEKKEISRAIKDIYKLWKDNKLCINRETNTEEYSREFQNKKYINIIKDIL